MKVLQPRSLARATELAERHAQLTSEIATIEANRLSALAATNAVADGLAAPLAEERDAIVAALEPWWAKSAEKLTGGKRKSIEIGGCVVGTHAGATSLTFPGGGKAALAAALASPDRRKLVATKPSLDKRGIAALLRAGGKIAERIGALGFVLTPGPETFFVAPIGSDDAKVSAG